MILNPKVLLLSLFSPPSINSAKLRNYHDATHVFYIDDGAELTRFLLELALDDWVVLDMCHGFHRVLRAV